MKSQVSSDDESWHRILLQTLSTHSKPLMSIDPKITLFHPRTPWMNILDYLQHKDNCFTLKNHAIIICKMNSDFVIHFEKKDEEGIICCSIVSREGISDEGEFAHVDQVIRDISNHLIRLSLILLSPQ